jgi:RHS repeat-associated protein
LSYINIFIEYGPFGEVLRATGPMARANPFRFSTKYQDDETDLLYYGYRYYSTGIGRWINRDPLGEFGGIALDAFVANDPISNWDVLGEEAGPAKAGGTTVPPKTVYCDAAQKHPENRWLSCACKVSAEINQLIAGLYLSAPFGMQDQNQTRGKVTKWFDCTRQCLVKKFTEFYKVYDGGAKPDALPLTPYWDRACKVCIGNAKARSSKECCEAMVVAEQNGVDDCSSNCGSYPGGPLPIPGFKGDFSNLEDRITYGKKRCCEDGGVNKSQRSPSQKL